jgi:hypothetical protein
MRKSLFLAPLLLLGVALAAAQDKPAARKEGKPDDKEPVIVKASLPRYFKQLGLSADQKKKVFTVKAKYAEKVQELQRQLEALKDQEKTDLEAVLTTAQKERLKELRSGKGADK